MGLNIGIGNYITRGRVTKGLPFNRSLIDAWFMSGISNTDRPTELVGINGNKFTTANFAWGGMSGFNGYKENYLSSTYSKNQARAIFTYSSNSIHITKILDLNKFFETNGTVSVSAHTIKVAGVSSNMPLVYTFRNPDNTSNTITITEDGIYDLPVTGIGYNGFSASRLGDCDITIEQVPLYEGSLCFDGIDDYCICDTMPIQTDYTVICKKVILASKTHTVASKRDDKTGVNNGAFQFEKLLGSSNTRVYSFGYLNQTSPTAINNIAVTYQTKDNYNGTFPLIVGSLSDTTQLTLGSTMPNLEALNGGIYYFALYDRSLTVEEIEREKIKLEDEWRKRGNIPLEYPFDFTKLYSNTEPHKLLLNDATSYYLFGGESGDRSFSVPSYKVKVTGLIDGDSVYIQAGGEWNIFVNITENGTYTIPATTYVNEAGYYEYSWQSMLNNGSKVTVEMLPL